MKGGRKRISVTRRGGVVERSEKVTWLRCFGEIKGGAR
jgi:hypothetical protein